MRVVSMLFHRVFQKKNGDFDQEPSVKTVMLKFRFGFLFGHQNHPFR